jgi:fibronectin type 3 domain-containing protein
MTGDAHVHLRLRAAFHPRSRAGRVLGCLLAIALAFSALFAVVRQEGASAAPGSAVHLNGSSQYIRMGGAAGAPADALTLSTFTLELWFKPTGVFTTGTTSTGNGGNTSIVPLITKGRAETETPTTDLNYFLGIDSATGRLAADFAEGAAGPAPSGNHPVIGVTTITQSQWHHGAVSYDGSVWRLYLDGKLEAQLATGAVPIPPANATISRTVIGSSWNSTGTAAGFFNGDVDEVRIWNLARSGSQIRANKDLEVTSGTGLVGRWGLNDVAPGGSGTNAANSIGGGLAGTLVGTPGWVAGYGFPDVAAPAAPQNLQASSGSGQIALNWNANSEADLAGYDVYRSTSSPVDTTTAPINGTDLVTSTSYVDQTAVNGTQYFYVVKAVDTADNHSAPSNEAGGTPTATTGKAIHLDGSTGYVDMGTADLGAATFTVETWFRQTGPGVSSDTGTNGLAAAVPLVTRGTKEADAGDNRDFNYWLGLDTSGHVAADFEEDASSTTPSLNHPIAGTTVATLNVWHHAAATYDGSTWRVYLDGRLEAKQVLSGVTPRDTSTSHTAIGTGLTSTGTKVGFFQGDVDETRIWDVARTGAQLRANRGTEILGPQADLIGRWGFEEGVNTTAADSSASGATGTLTGGVTWVSGYGFPQDVSAPTAPQNLVATPGNASVALTWDANGETDLAGYDVFRSTSQPVSTAGTPLNGIDLVQSTTFTDTTAANGTQYFYAVRAVDTSNNASGPSNEVPATPTNFTGKALTLNGSNQYVRVQTPFATTPDALNLATFTLETWFRQTGVGSPTSTGTGGIAAAVPLVSRGRAEQETAPQDMDYFLGIDDTGHLVGDFEEGQAGPAPSQNHPVTGATVVTQNVWHHAAATYDGTTWRLYLDGRLDAKLVLGAVPPNTAGTHDVAIGSAVLSPQNGTAAGFFQGDIDEVRIWSGARTGSQIRANRDVPIVAAAGLVGRWGFDEASGNALDTSGTGYDGVLSGTPAPTRISGYTFPADAVAPGVPQNPVATPGSASVTLTWDPVVDANLAGYDVFRSTSSPVDTAGAPINGPDLVSGATFTDTTAANGTQYFYVVQAVDGADNRSGSSAEAFATPVPGDPVLIGAGDIAGSWTQDSDTAALIQANPGAAVFTLGDNAYNAGAANEFFPYYDQTWGTFKDRTRPAAGNHDYGTANAQGYFDYFNGVGVNTGPAGPRPDGYYSYDLGSWHIVVLNSECEPGTGLWSAGGCAVGSPQYNWLVNDLNTATTNNIIAMWHKPRVTSSGSQAHMQPLYQVLYDHGAELVLAGHFHNYERFQPLDGNLAIDTTYGIRNITVGTGGNSLAGFGSTVTGSVVRNNSTWGVLKLTLHPSSYDWQFIPIAGQSFTDSGTSGVHGPPPDTTTPTVTIVSAVPSTLNPGDTGTNLTWHASENGTYTVRVGGTDCTTGTVVAGPTAYTTAPANVVTNVAIGSLAIGANTIRVCVADAVPNTGSATTTVTRNGPQSTITFRSAATATNTPSTSLVIPKPASVVAGDVLLATVDVQGAPAVSAPAGWTLVRTDSSTATTPSVGQTTFVHVVGASEPASYTFTWTGSLGAAGAILAYSGVDTTSPIDVHSGAVANAAAVTAPSVTTTGAGRMLVALFGVSPERTITGPAGMTQRHSVVNGAVPGQKASSLSAEVVQAAAGASGGRTATLSSAGRAVGQLVALRPGTSGGGGGPGPAAPIIDSVTVTPNSNVATNATLTANVTSHDPDPGDTVTLQYQWVKNGTDITGATTSTLNLATAGNGDRGDSITVRVRGTDGANLGAPVTSAAVVVQNTAPTATVSLNTNAPLTGDTLTATATKADIDPADTVTLTYVWKVNGTVKSTNAASASLTDTFDLSVAGNGDPGDVVTVEVTPNDGTAPGNLVSASATVANSPPPPGTAVTFRSASSAANAVATTLVLPKPAGVVAGDALLAVVDAQGAPVVTPPAGWTLVRADTSTSVSPTLGQSVYVYIAGASEPASYTFTLATARGAAGGILAYDNVDNANPIDVHSGAAASASAVTAPAVTTTGPDRMIVGIFGIAPSRTVTPPAGMTERFQVSASTTAGEKVTSEATDVAQPVAGSSGARTASFSGAVGRVIGQLVALRPG